MAQILVKEYAGDLDGAREWAQVAVARPKIRGSAYWRGGFLAQPGFVETSARNWQAALEHLRELAEILTPHEVLDDWLAVGRQGLEPTTAANYDSIIDKRLRPHLGHVPATDLSPAHVARCCHTFRKPGSDQRGKDRTQALSVTSILRAHAVLRTALA